MFYYSSDCSVDLYGTVIGIKQHIRKCIRVLNTKDMQSMKKAVSAKKKFPDVKNYTAEAGIMFT